MKVKTINGNIVDSINCRKIKGEYYEKYKDVYPIKDRWYINNGRRDFTFDYETQEWKLNKNNMIYGIVGVSDNKPTFGWFTPNVYKNINYSSVDGNYIISEMVYATLKYIRFDSSEGKDIFLNNIERQDIDSADLIKKSELLSTSINLEYLFVDENFDIIEKSALRNEGIGNYFFSNHLDERSTLLLCHDSSDYLKFILMTPSLIPLLKRSIDVINQNVTQISRFNQHLQRDINDITTALLDFHHEEDLIKYIRRFYENSINMPYEVLRHVYYRYKLGDIFTIINLGKLFQVLYKLYNKDENGINSDMENFKPYMRPLLSPIFDITNNYILTDNVVENFDLGNIYDNLSNNEAESRIFINSDVANLLGITEETKFTPIQKNSTNSLEYRQLSYCLNGSSPIEKEIAIYFNEFDLDITEEAKNLSKYLMGYSFGVEHETNTGLIPKRLLYQTGMVPLKDGSLDGGYEYTTFPMQGEEGIQMLINQLNVLNKFCTIGDNCSTHIHIGNIPSDKQFIVAIYMLYRQIQNEINEIIPPYKKNSLWVRGKKDYSKDIRSLGLFSIKMVDENGQVIQSALDNAFKTICKFLLMNNLPSNFDTIIKNSETYQNLNLSSSLSSTAKWNITSRYYALNLFGLLNVSQSDRTVEFRVHSPTMNKYKLFNWLFICIAIIEYAKKNSIKILKSSDKINLYEVFSVFDDIDNDNFSMKEYLNEYCLVNRYKYDRYLYSDSSLESSEDNIYEDKEFEFKKGNYLDIKCTNV